MPKLPERGNNMIWVFVIGCGCFVTGAVCLSLGQRVFCLKHRRFEPIVTRSQVKKP